MIPCSYCGSRPAGTHLKSCPQRNHSRAAVLQTNEIQDLRTALALSTDNANLLRAKLAAALEKQAACIGHTADIVVYRTTLKLALRALAHYRDDDDQVLVAIREALARGAVR